MVARQKNGVYIYIKFGVSKILFDQKYSKKGTTVKCYYIKYIYIYIYINIF